MITRNQTEYNLYIRLELAGTLKCSEAWTGDEHRHAFWEILYVSSGSCNVTCDGRVDTLNADDAILLSPMELHRFSTTVPETVLVYIGFRCEAGQDAWPKDEDDKRMFFRYIKNRDVLTRTMREMPDQQDVGEETGIRLVEGLIPVVQWINGIAAINSDLTANQQNSLCMKTIRYLRSNIDRFVTVEEIAASLYVTPHYLGILFSSRMGKTILKYQQELKLERAATLIRQGDISLTEISDQLGYSSPQYFSKCFRNFYGFSPNRMKNHMQ